HMKTTKLLIAASIAVATMFSSCSGPAGAAGPAGATGATGPAGNPNIAVGLGSIPSASWIQSSNVYYYQFNDAAITDYNTNTVIVYVQGTTSATADYFGLPVTNFLVNNDAMSYSYNNGIITFYYVNTATTTTPPSVALNVKVVVIPQSVIKQHPGLNTSDYHAVMAIVNEEKSSQASAK
ncbi:MAG TPA: hypothetical protein VN922_05560, partial [Bacteroidia bacterium]|nr:hypothetical protein [Bacteroidia bacterium]